MIYRDLVSLFVCSEGFKPWTSGNGGTVHNENMRVGWVGTGVMDLAMYEWPAATSYQITVYTRRLSKLIGLCEKTTILVELPMVRGNKAMSSSQCLATLWMSARYSGNEGDPCGHGLWERNSPSQYDQQSTLACQRDLQGSQCLRLQLRWHTSVGWVQVG